MHKVIGLFVVAILLSFASVGNAVIINGSFETGNLNGWEMAIEGATYWDEGSNGFVDVKELPFSIFDATSYSPITPMIASDNYYSAVQGDNYLEIYGNQHNASYSYDNNEYYISLTGSIISVSQELCLKSGDVLSGWVAFYTEDYPPYNADRAFVEISNSMLSDQPIQITVKDAYGENWGMKPEPQSSPWTYWAWTAPSDGIFNLSLNNYMDDQAKSIACFDDIRIYQAVPEPSTMVLLGIGMIGLFVMNRKKVS